LRVGTSRRKATSVMCKAPTLGSRWQGDACGWAAICRSTAGRRAAFLAAIFRHR
jgi:hypothetical protein